MNENKFANHNYSKIEEAFKLIIDSNGKDGLVKLKNEINKIFKECDRILYTNNTDKVFFGMSIYTKYKNRKFAEVITSYEDVKSKLDVESFTIELDSKLFNPILGLTPKHMTSILLHEIGHIVEDQYIVDDFRDAIEYHSAKTQNNIDKSALANNIGLIKCAFYDFIKKTKSFFYRDADEIKADKFVHACGYGIYLEEAFNIITSHSLVLNKDVKNKLLVLSWVLSIYKNIGIYRTDSIRKLNSAKKMSPSIIEKELLLSTIKDWDIDNKLSKSLFESVIEESKNKFSFIDKMRLSGLRGLKNDLFELKIQVKNATDEDGALYVLRLLNARITTLEEYINYHSEEMREHELEEWENTLSEYITLREELTKKNTIKKVKMYGLFADYSTLPPEYQQNMY